MFYKTLDGHVSPITPEAFKRLQKKGAEGRPDGAVIPFEESDLSQATWFVVEGRVLRADAVGVGARKSIDREIARRLAPPPVYKPEPTTPPRPSPREAERSWEVFSLSDEGMVRLLGELAGANQQWLEVHIDEIYLGMGGGDLAATHAEDGLYAVNVELVGRVGREVGVFSPSYLRGQAEESLYKMSVEQLAELLDSGATTYAVAPGAPAAEIAPCYNWVAKTKVYELSVAMCDRGWDGYVEAVRIAGPTATISLPGGHSASVKTAIRAAMFERHGHDVFGFLPRLLDEAGISSEVEVGEWWLRPPDKLEPGIHYIPAHRDHTRVWGAWHEVVEHIEAHPDLVEVRVEEALDVRRVLVYWDDAPSEAERDAVPWAGAYRWDLYRTLTTKYTLPGCDEPCIHVGRTVVFSSESDPDRVRDLVATGAWPDNEVTVVEVRDGDAWYGDLSD